MVGETESIRERVVAAVAQSFWSELLQPLTNLNKHSRPAACRAPPGAFGHGMHRNGDMGNIVITAVVSIRGSKKRRWNARAKLAWMDTATATVTRSVPSSGAKANRPDLVPR